MCLFLVSGQIPPAQIPSENTPVPNTPGHIPNTQKGIKYRKIKVHFFKKKYYLNMYIHIIYILHTYYKHIT